MITSLDQLLALVHQLLGHVAVAHELLEAKKGENAATQSQVGCDTQQQDQHGEVDVEAVGYEGDHIHVPHYLQHKPYTQLDSSKLFHSYTTNVL